MKIYINWTDISEDDNHPLWNARYVIYAYTHPKEDEILYIGKCLSTTVRSRWNAKDKLDNFWSHLENERGIYKHGILVGEISIKERKEFSDTLLDDIEKILIYIIEPWGNIQCVNSISTNHKLKIICEGDWTF